MNLFHVLQTFLSLRDRLLMILFAVCSFGVSLLETVCLSALMPFAFIVFKQQQIKDFPLFALWEQYIPLPESSKTIAVLAVLLIVLFIVRAVITAWFTYALNQFAQKKSRAISCMMYEGYLRGPYRDHIQENSAAVLKKISTDPFHVGVVISSCLQALTEVCIIVTLYAALLVSNWKFTITGTLVGGLVGILLVPPLLRVVSSYGTQNGFFLRHITQTFNESFGNFKMIRICHVERLFFERFERAAQGFAQTQARYFTLQSLPRLFLETAMVLVLIGGIALAGRYAVFAESISLSDLSLYAIAFYRVVPALNRLLTYYTQIKFSLGLIGSKSSLLPSYQQPLPTLNTVSFERSIEIRDLTYAYEPQNPVLKGASLFVRKGERVGVMGKSGSGKTTFIDIVLGLLVPTQGTIVVDGIPLEVGSLSRWQQFIGYLPQQVYLFDGSVAANVVFGRPYDEALLVSCLKRARIYDFLMTKQGIETQVGEGGTQMSGGQRQRVALARALYGNPLLLILDEATSALDKETESLVFQDLFTAAQGMTMIIVSHRTEMLTYCDSVYEMVDGVLMPATQHRSSQSIQAQETL